MKNTFVLSDVTLTVEGNPVSIGKLEVTSEMSPQEIATSGGLIKSLVGELKPLITEATKPVVATPATITTPVNNTRNNYKNNYGNNNYKNDNYKNNYDRSGNYNKSNHNNKYLRVQEAFNNLTVPEELKETGGRTWTYECGSFSNGDRLRINIDNAKFGVVHVNVMTANQSFHVHVYPDNKQFSGVSPETMVELLRWTKMPEAIQGYILKIATL